MEVREMKTMTKAEVLEVLDGYIADLEIICGAVAPGTQTKLQQARAAVSEVYEEVDILRSSVDRMQQQWAENKPAVEYKQEVERLKRAVEKLAEEFAKYQYNKQDIQTLGIWTEQSWIKQRMKALITYYTGDPT